MVFLIPKISKNSFSNFFLDPSNRHHANNFFVDRKDFNKTSIFEKMDYEIASYTFGIQYASSTVDSTSSSPASINSTSDSPSSQLRRRTKFTLAFKKKILDYLEENNTSINKCAKRFEIDRRLISRWY
jgi:hypothetical protein